MSKKRLHHQHPPQGTHRGSHSIVNCQIKERRNKEIEIRPTHHVLDIDIYVSTERLNGQNIARQWKRVESMKTTEVTIETIAAPPPNLVMATVNSAKAI